MKSKNTERIKIIIADDHPVCLEGLSKMLSRVPEFEVIGEAKNGQELISISKDLLPDVIITDIRMPEMDGIEATLKLSKDLPATGIIALSMIGEHDLITEMIGAGAKGYLSKIASQGEIISAIKEVREGGTYYCKDTTAQLVRSLMPTPFTNKKRVKAPICTQREISIIKLICDGFSHKEIATKLHLSPRTIEWHKNQIMEKLDVKSSASIAVYAIKNKICS